ncbi:MULTISPECIES: PsiF family protein [unclassified Cupriavidus]|uniref:PsiF family protein n=1 Tax=unclassified Cupriavidus TaxID=2640874 RepID=UPI00313DBB41
MKKLIAMCVLVTPLIAMGAFAQGASAPAAAAGNSQQDRMKACNTQATGKKGDDRKKFMSDCLSGKPTAAAEPKTQQEKMSACSKQGKGKKGDDYKAFMKDCLSKPAA